MGFRSGFFRGLMKKIIVLIGLVLVVGVVGVLVITRAGTSPASDTTSKKEIVPTITPAAVKLKVFFGTVTVNASMASDGQVVKVGDVIATEENSRGELIYPNGTVTRLDARAKVVLREFESAPQKVAIRLEVGRVWSRVTKLLGGESYQTETGTVVATVRGTSYGHGILANGDNRVTTLEGEVQSGCVVGGQEASVGKFDKVEMSCAPGAEVKKVKLTDKDISGDEWLNFNVQEDKKLEAEVLGLSTKDDQPTPTPARFDNSVSEVVMITCTGPDGVVFRATKANCDNLNAFWKANTPSNPNPNGTGSSAGSSGARVEPTPTPTLVPVKLVLATAQVTSTGTGIQVTVSGMNLNQNARFKLTPVVVTPTPIAGGVLAKLKAWFEPTKVMAEEEEEQEYGEDVGNAKFEEEKDDEEKDKRVSMTLPNGLVCGFYDVGVYFVADPVTGFVDPRTAVLVNQYLCGSVIVKDLTGSEDGDWYVNAVIVNSDQRLILEGADWWLADKRNIEVKYIPKRIWQYPDNLGGVFSPEQIPCGQKLRMYVKFPKANNLVVEGQSFLDDESRWSCRPTPTQTPTPTAMPTPNLGVQKINSVIDAGQAAIYKLNGSVCDVNKCVVQIHGVGLSSAVGVAATTGQQSYTGGVEVAGDNLVMANFARLEVGVYKIKLWVGDAQLDSPDTFEIR